MRSAVRANEDSQMATLAPAKMAHLGSVRRQARRGAGYGRPPLGKQFLSFSQKIVSLRALQTGGCSRLPFTYLTDSSAGPSHPRTVPAVRNGIAACLVPKKVCAHEVLRYSAEL